MSIPLPETGFLRIKQIIGDRKAEIPPLIPVAESTWWKGVSERRFPQPIRLSKGLTVWRAEDIRDLIDNPPCVTKEEPKRRGGTEKAGSSQ